METLKHLNIKPTYSDSFTFGWELMKEKFLRLFLLILILGAVAIPLGMLSDAKELHTAGAVFLNIVGFAYLFLVYPVFEYSGKYMFLQAVRNEELDYKNILRGFNNYLNVILSYLLVMALVGISFVFLIVPGIIVACRLAFTKYLVMDKGLDPITAVEESWRMTKGLGWTIFGMAIMSFFIALAGLLCLVVGIFPAIIWINNAFAALYQGALNQKAAAAVQAETPPPVQS